MKNYTQKKKKVLLAKMFELMVGMGWNIEPYMGVPLSKFNFEQVEKQIEKLRIELDYVHSD